MTVCLYSSKIHVMSIDTKTMDKKSLRGKGGKPRVSSPYTDTGSLMVRGSQQPFPTFIHDTDRRFRDFQPQTVYLAEGIDSDVVFSQSPPAVHGLRYIHSDHIATHLGRSSEAVEKTRERFGDREFCGQWRTRCPTAERLSFYFSLLAGQEVVVEHVVVGIKAMSGWNYVVYGLRYIQSDESSVKEKEKVSD